MCGLKKSLYGLKQAPIAWYAKIDSFLLSQNFSTHKYDPNVYVKMIHASSIIIIIFYVDEILMTGISMKDISSLKDALNHDFSITDLGLLNQFLGLDISQSYL